jgi:acetolactate synthase-1/2/3 large subunit
MPSLKASELFVRCLEEEGVEILFGLPGEENLDLLDALIESSIRFVTVRHEQGAAFMADVYGRLTGRAGVCLATLGPGATNLATGVADANLDRAPLVALTGQAGLDRMHKESHQVLDLVHFFRPITKWNAQIGTARIIPEAVRKAFKLAQTEKPGATHLVLPEDVMAQQLEAPLRTLPRQQPQVPEPSASQIERAVAILEDADCPIVLAGNGVVRAGAAEALTRFAEDLGIPVAHTFMGKGVVPWKSEMSLLACGLQSGDYEGFGFDRADVVVCVGYDLVEWDPRHWNPRGDKRIVHVDASPAEVDESYVVAVGVVGDIGLALERIRQRVSRRERACTASLRQTVLAELEGHARDESFPLKPQRILHDLRDALGPDDVLVSDVGAHKLWIARMYPCARPNTAIISNGFAAMGIAIPGAIAAKLVHPERKVVAATGDGGFAMNAQELETAVREGAPFVALVFTDGRYGLIEWNQRRRFGRSAFAEFGRSDLVAFARSFGADGYRIDSASQLPTTLRRALRSDRVAVIDCPIDYTENENLANRLGEIRPGL